MASRIERRTTLAARKAQSGLVATRPVEICRQRSGKKENAVAWVGYRLPEKQRGMCLKLREESQDSLRGQKKDMESCALDTSESGYGGGQRLRWREDKINQRR